MPLVNAKCTNCGADLKVDNLKDAAICEFCGSPYVVEKAINNYTISNHNYIKADVVNIYDSKYKCSNSESHSDFHADPSYKLEQYLLSLKHAGFNRLISVHSLIEMVEFSNNNDDYTDLQFQITEYCNNLNFCFDLSYYKYTLSYNKSSFQKLWSNSGKTGCDGEYFFDWIQCDSKGLNSISPLLLIIQEKLTLYFIELLMQGKISVYSPPWSIGESLFDIPPTTKGEYLYLEEKVYNKFLLERFVQGLDNARKLNILSLGSSPWVFVLGKYAVINKDEHYNCHYDQEYIDKIREKLRSKYIKSANKLIKSRILEDYIILRGEELTRVFSDDPVAQSFQSDYQYIVNNVDESGLWIRQYTPPRENQNEFHPIKVTNIKSSVIKLRMIMNRCQYCGSKFKGIIHLECSKCGRPKDYK